jgi:hypothetical protein
LAANRLDKAAGIGRAADACAGAGFHEKGLEVALDIEQLLYEATTLLNAASLIIADGERLPGFLRCGTSSSAWKSRTGCSMLTTSLDKMAVDTHRQHHGVFYETS